MKEFRVVGILVNSNNIEYGSWGNCNLSIQALQELAHYNNIKYKEWYLEYR